MQIKEIDNGIYIYSFADPMNGLWNGFFLKYVLVYVCIITSNSSKLKGKNIPQKSILSKILNKNKN